MLHRAFVLLALLWFGGHVDRALAQPGHPKTCLVLGGGGARGAAHIGVLKVLEREHIPVDCITGTSMGAIVGGLYAAGYKADEIEIVLDGIDWKDMFSDDPPREDLPMRRKEDELRFLGGIELGLRDGKIAFPRGVVQGQKLQLLLRRLLLSTLQTKKFDDLPIPFRSIATDIGSGEKVVFADGDLPSAIRASMSVPAAFAPIRYRGHLLVDGGIVDNVPIDEARAMGGERLIVVDVGMPLATEDQLNSPFSIANQMLGAMMKKLTDEQLRTLGAHDVLIVPALGNLDSAAFNRSPEAVVFGEAAAEQHLDKLRTFAVGDTEYSRFAGAHRQRAFDPPLIAFLEVRSNRSRTAGYVEQRLSDVVGKPFDPKQIEKEIGSAYGEGSYERITYDFVDREGATGLSVQPVDKGWGPNFLRIGLRLSSTTSPEATATSCSRRPTSRASTASAARAAIAYSSARSPSCTASSCSRGEKTAGSTSRPICSTRRTISRSIRVKTSTSRATGARARLARSRSATRRRLHGSCRPRSNMATTQRTCASARRRNCRPASRRNSAASSCARFTTTSTSRRFRRAARASTSQTRRY